uniref:Elongation factor 1-gamma n=1 Tax=Maconellicoccus hirsutus TaxID=177089 RepID=A2I3W5_MACHI|nr:putative translation elongation factor 1-gamma [Maconellicoccus hirsutus]
MASGTLYAIPGNFRTDKVLIAAQYSGAHVKTFPEFVFGETNKSEAFLKKFPLGKVPAFETNDDKYLVESNAIAYYLGNQQLRGVDAVQQAQVIQWLDFADGAILPASSRLVFPLLGIMPFNKQTANSAKEDVKAVLKYLDEYLLTRTYLVGERITLADIAVATSLFQLYTHVLDPSFRKPYINVNRWFVTFINQREVKTIIGEFKLCEKQTEYDGKKIAEQKGKSAPKEKKEKKPAPKKETPPDDELDPTEEALAAEPKSKSPFDALPKGTFDFEDFKRFYSNEEVDKSIPYFWEKFDKENCSIWFGEYKYNHELTKIFMSCNLITGMFQRLEKMKKQAFASVCLFGEDNNSTISGVWVWRGQGLAFELSPDFKTDYDTYEWTKLNPDDEETKKLVQQYFSWEGTDKEGRKFNQGKTFK